MGCRIFHFPTTSVATASFYDSLRHGVTRHPLRENEPPLKSLLQRNRRGGERSQESEQLQKLIAAIYFEGLAQRPGQSFFADPRSEPGSGGFPKTALHEELQPPLSPALQRATVDPEAFPQRLHALWFESMPHGRNQNHRDAPVNPASQKTQRRRRQALAAALLRTTKTVTIDLLGVFRSASRLALVITSMHFARAVQTTALAPFFRNSSVAFFEKLK